MCGCGGCGVGSHSEHLFQEPSSKLCQNWLRTEKGTLYLRAAVHRRCQRPPKGPGTNLTVETPYGRSTHVNMRLDKQRKRKRKKEEDKNERKKMFAATRVSGDLRAAQTDN